jgi:FAD/FMN-containing dehydrogenase
MQDKHRQQVADIAAQVKGYFELKKPFYIYHGSTNATRILSFKRDAMVDTSNLNNVLHVNTNMNTAIVESNVPMDKLVKETLKYGLVPPVVMEFPGITVGGGIQGGAGESGSFKYGCFNQICNSYEMVLANGEIIHASPKENTDLFYGTAGAFGTLGVITSAEVQLIPAKKYVELTYLPVTSFSDAVKVLERTVKQDYDFIDSIMFGANHGVIIVGSLSDNIVGSLQQFTRAQDPWFYLHAEKIDAKHEKFTETVPLVDYLFRYDRGAFWVGKYAFELFGKPFNRFTRWALNPILHTRKLYQALQESGASQQYLVQDLALPVSKAVSFMEFVDKELQIYPLWLCPIKTNTESPFLSSNLKTPLVINVGVWGNRIESREAFLTANKLVEQTLKKLGGKKWFYAHSYYTKEEFWSLYNKSWYDALRKKYAATSLPDVFEKIQVKGQYDINLKRGVYRTIFGRAKLRMKD